MKYTLLYLQKKSDIYSLTKW